MRWAHLDASATKAAKFKDRRSWVGYNSKGRYQRLFGKDMVNLRHQAMERDDYCCVDCLEPVVMTGPLELSHNIPRSLGGSDTLDNVNIRCRRHHRKRDLHGQDGHY